MLSVLTIEKLDNFKNKVIVQQRYKTTLEKQERAEFNERERRLFGSPERTCHRQVTFKGFLFKEEREKNEDKYRQYRFIAINLIKTAYGHTLFFRKLQERRPEFVEDLLDAIQQAADKMPKKSFKRIEDVARIKLEDPVLQEVFYRMLKGSVGKDEFKSLPERLQKNRDKAYFPLLTFFNYDGLDKKISLRLAPRELLFAIYGNEELVNKVLTTREELSKELRSTKSMMNKAEAEAKFKTEFEGKQKQEIIDVLDYSISQTSQVNRT